MKNLFKLVLCGITLILAGCVDPNPGIDQEPRQGITYKSCADKMEIKGEAQQVTITITADAAWEAKVSQTRIATISSGASGEAGTHDIVLDFTENETAYSRNLTLSVKVEGVAQNVTICRFTQLSVSAKGTDANVNKNFTWALLDKYYLWNKDLRDKGAPNWDQAYDDFLDGALRSITTNTMDGYLHTPASGAPYWVYYSYIQRTTPSAQSMTRAEKAFYQGYGASVYGIKFDSNSNAIHLAVEFVYPDSPAAKAGLKRGDFIAKINGVALNESNWAEYLINTFIYEVPVGTVCDMEVQEFNWVTLDLAAPRQVTMTAASYCENPVLYYDVFTFKSTQDENQKINIAYMVYNTFEAAFDDEIKKAFDLFAQAATENQKPIEYLILDLRYNGGGNVSSCCYLSSLIAGNKALKGGNPQVFMYHRFNDERMAEQGRDRNDYTTYKADLFDKSAASAYNFPFKEVYVIGTFDTASSSEMLINALRGIGMKVTLVGQTTNGKNVGMEVFNTQSSGSPIDGNHYIFAPITFQSYNCNGESDYDNGFTPDIHCKNSDWDGMPPVDWGTFTVEVKGERPGETQAILADFFSVALNDLLTKEFSAQSSVKRLSKPSESNMPKVATRLVSPERKRDILRQNAWVLAEE